MIFKIPAKRKKQKRKKKKQEVNLYAQYPVLILTRARAANPDNCGARFSLKRRRIFIRRRMNEGRKKLNVSEF